MATNIAAPTRIAELLSFDPLTGDVTRRLAIPGHPKGKLIRARTSDGYFRVGVDGRDYLLHRVAWCLHHGAWPAGVIDHINGDGTDNRITNLRDVDQTINLLNQKRQRRSASGTTGVDILPGGKFRARLKANGIRAGSAHIGTFQTREQAEQAYAAAKSAILGAVP